MNAADYLSVRTASLVLDGVSERLIREAVAAGQLPAARFGKAPAPDAPDRRTIRIKRADLIAWADSLVVTRMTPTNSPARRVAEPTPPG